MASATGGAAGRSSPTFKAQAGGQSLTVEAVLSMIDSANQSQDEKIELKISAAESRLSSQIGTMPTKWTFIYGVAWLTGVILALSGALLAILAFGGDRFDGGLGMGTAIGDKFIENTRAIDQNSKRDDETRQTLDALTKSIERLADGLKKSAQPNETDSGK